MQRLRCEITDQHIAEISTVLYVFRLEYAATNLINLFFVINITLASDMK
jgi:hypothetical protein